MLSSRGSTNPLRAAAKKGDAAAPQRPRVQDLFPSRNGKMGMKLNDREAPLVLLVLDISVIKLKIWIPN